MTKNPRIFVGTMYSGEAEFQESSKIIVDQEDVLVKHIVIKNLSEIDAHNALWDKWNNQKNQYDLFVKIDADTLLIDNRSLIRIWKLFKSNPRITGAQIMLQDYFTQDLIAGLNCFTPKVIFKKSKNKLMPDRVDTNHDIELRGDLVKHLNPIGYHCKYPSDIQSFHFGIHRALKKQRNIIKKIAQIWLSDNDRARGFALLGASKASFWIRNKVDYNSQKFNKLFNDIENINNNVTINKFCKKII